jgi:hypothetical protein
MIRRCSRFAILCIICLAALLLGSCSSRLGWGLVLWTAPEGPIPAGSIVPVYIKSNIEKVYVVGVPGAKGKDKGKKIELKLWQLELYSTRSKAEASAKAMGPNLSLYMVAMRDGLPLRDRPANTGRRVYRLRVGQSIKVLEKVAGEDVSTGGQALPGSWYRVLADDGTTGYAFSYALRLYDESKEGPPAQAVAKQALSGRVDLFFSRSWRPEYFQEMVEDGRIDLDYFSLRYGLFVDAIRRQIRLELPKASEIFNYREISEAKGIYVFEGSPLKIRIESDSRMLCSWEGTLPDESDPLAAPAEGIGADDDESPQAARTSAETPSAGTTGASGSAAFVVLTSEPRETIRLEALRRQKLLTAFVEEVGGTWHTEDAGKLTLSKNGRFTWTGRGETANARLPEGAGGGGEVAFRSYLDPSLESAWSGAFSLRFDPATPESKRQRWVDFLYRRSPAGLVLANAASTGLLVRSTDPRTEPLILEPEE